MYRLLFKYFLFAMHQGNNQDDYYNYSLDDIEQLREMYTYLFVQYSYYNKSSPETLLQKFQTEFLNANKGRDQMKTLRDISYILSNFGRLLGSGNLNQNFPNDDMKEIKNWVLKLGNPHFNITEHVSKINSSQFESTQNIEAQNAQMNGKQQLQNARQKLQETVRRNASFVIQ